MTYHDIQGWFDFEDVYQEMVDSAPSPAVFVEVGCWKGKSTVALAKMIEASGKDVSFHAVDTFTGNPGDAEMAKEVKFWGGSLLEIFRTNLHACRVRRLVEVWPFASPDGAKYFPDLDFVFLDADHSEPAVRADIAAWWPKIKPGGYLGGHDYYSEPAVGKVFRELFPDRLLIMGNSVLVRKDG